MNTITILIRDDTPRVDAIIGGQLSPAQCADACYAMARAFERQAVGAECKAKLAATKEDGV